MIFHGVGAMDAPPKLKQATCGDREAAPRAAEADPRTEPKAPPRLDWGAAVAEIAGCAPGALWGGAAA